MLGENLKEPRENNGLNQPGIDAALCVDKTYVSRMESNSKLLSRDKLRTLVRFYSVKESNLKASG
ncbi:MAG: helix-turn-helix transcriptional regulator [Bacteroidia bacterium]